MSGGARWVQGAAWVVVAGCVAMWVVRGRELEEVRARQRVRAAVGEEQRMVGVRVSASGDAGKSATKGSAPLSAQERLELMDLRRRVTELSDAKRRLAGVADEHARLTIQAADAKKLSDRKFPDGWVARSLARNRGFATPQAAFETLVWAIHNRDTNVLFQALVPEIHAQVAQNQERSGLDAFWAESQRIPGFVVRSATPVGDGEQELVVEMAPGVTLPKLRAARVNGGWRLNLFQ